MKKLKLLLVLIVLITLVQCKKENNFIEHEKFQCELIDYLDNYDPVCGCDGKTYKNKFRAQCQGGITKYREGECN